MEIQTSTKTTKQEIQSINISRLDLIRLVESKGVAIPSGSQINIFVKVPGGGYYSGEKLDIDDDFPVQVTIEAGEKIITNNGKPKRIG